MWSFAELRAVQRAAVRAGGGFNHRDSLSTAVLIKDNHLAVLGIADAVVTAKATWPGRLVHVEATTLDELRRLYEGQFHRKGRAE